MHGAAAISHHRCLGFSDCYYAAAPASNIARLHDATLGDPCFSVQAVTPRYDNVETVYNDRVQHVYIEVLILAS